MRTNVLIAMTLVLVAAGVYAKPDSHIFTDTKGRTLQASLVGYDPISKKVTVKPAHRGASTVPISIFSTADQNYIIQWSKNQSFLNERKFIVDIKRMKEKNSSAGKEGYDMSMKAYDNYFKLDFENRSNIDFKNMTVEYVLFYKQDSWTQNRHAKTSKDGTKYVKTTLTIPSKEKKEVSTEKLSLKLYRESGFDANSTWVDLDSELEGILVKLTIKTKDGDSVTRQLHYPDDLKKAWTTKTVNATIGTY